MKAVYTYWSTTQDKEKINQGFNCTQDLAMMMGYSLGRIKKQPGIASTQLVTNTIGKKLLIDKYKLPFDEVAIILDPLDDKLDPNLWAYAKLTAYAHQKQPFIHIDNDVILFQELPGEIFTAPISFQNREDLIGFVGYDHIVKQSRHFIPPEILDNRPNWALNCGIVAATDLELIQYWYDLATHFIFNDDNARFWADPEISKHGYNHLFEQYFISSIADARELTDQVGLLLPNFEKQNWSKPSFDMVHLWGAAKNEEQYVKKIQELTLRDFPGTFKAIIYADKSHQEIFEDIYIDKTWGIRSGGGSMVEVTGEYRDFLQSFFKEYKVRSVVDLGCGFWEFNDLLDWKGITYKGLDVARKVIRNNIKKHDLSGRTWEVADILHCQIPKADLLIIKDVMIHWTNPEIQEFLSKEIPVKYILVTNDTQENENKDISVPGQFHALDITQEPFNIEAEPIFIWKEQNKTTHLIKVTNDAIRQAKSTAA